MVMHSPEETLSAASRTPQSSLHRGAPASDDVLMPTSPSNSASHSTPIAQESEAQHQGQGSQDQDQDQDRDLGPGPGNLESGPGQARAGAGAVWGQGRGRDQGRSRAIWGQDQDLACLACRDDMLAGRRWSWTEPGARLQRFGLPVHDFNYGTIGSRLVVPPREGQTV
jgi:hypothetical protein